jgi:penicillin-binding protein 1A
VSGVWFGNDDHTSMKDMTGGTLPAMAWKEVMAFAHQNLEIRPIPGLPESATAVAFASGRAPTTVQNAQSNAPQLAPGSLSRRSFEVIGGIGNLFRSVERAGQPDLRSSRADPPGPRIAMP